LIIQEVLLIWIIFYSKAVSIFFDNHIVIKQSEQLLQRDVRKYDEAPEWQLPEPGAFASAKSFRDKVVMPFVNKLKTLIKNLTIQCVRLKEEVLQLRKEKKRLSDDVEFYKGEIKDMSDMTELLQSRLIRLFVR